MVYRSVARLKTDTDTAPLITYHKLVYVNRLKKVFTAVWL